MISAQEIKKLRDKTGAPIGKIKEALEKAGGDEGQAMAILREAGAAVLAMREGKEAKEGVIAVYLHHNHKVAVLLKLFAETDFVAKNESFRELGDDLAMQISAMEPKNNEELLAQPYLKDETITVADRINEAATKLGEKIVIGEFTRYQI